MAVLLLLLRYIEGVVRNWSQSVKYWSCRIAVLSSDEMTLPNGPRNDRRMEHCTMTTTNATNDFQLFFVHSVLIFSSILCGGFSC